MIIFVAALAFTYANSPAWVKSFEVEGWIYWDHCIFTSDDRLWVHIGADRSSVIVRESSNPSHCFEIRSPAKVQTTALTPNGQYIAFGADDGSIYVYRTADQVLIKEFHFTNSVPNSLVFSPDSQLMVCGYRDGHLKIWSTDSWRDVFKIRAHPGDVEYCTFSRDGTRLYTHCRHARDAATDAIDFEQAEGAIWNPRVGVLLEKSSKHSGLSFAALSDFNLGNHISPDRTRYLDRMSFRENRTVHDSRDGSILASLPKTASKDTRTSFSNTGRYIVTSREKIRLFRQSYPEWWWGRIVRPEAWVALISFILVLRQSVIRRWLPIKE